MARSMNGQATQVGALPPTLGIKDSATRNYLESLSNILAARSGDTDPSHPQRFITANEFQSLSNQAMLRAFGAPGGAVGFPPGTPGLPGTNAEAIDNLADLLRKSLIAQLLSQSIELIDIAPIRERVDGLLNRFNGLKEGITRVETLFKDADQQIYNQLNQIVLRIGVAEGLIVQETNLRVTADQALFNQIEAVRLRVGEAEGAIIDETTLRVTADQAIYTEINAVKLRVGAAEGAITQENSIRVTEVQAIARAVNTIWAKIGGTQAVIQQGSNVSATPNIAEATKWEQVQSSVTDPRTGAVYSSSIVEDVRTVANATLSKFSSIYTVRAQIDYKGRNVVGGFGLAATSAANPAEAPTIDFGVAADRFFITSVTTTGSAADQEARGSEFPFIVLTRDEVVNGVVYHPGVYMKSVVIGDASIDTAKIKDLAVDTLKIRGEAVTTPRGAYGSGQIILTGLSPVTVLFTPAVDVAGGSVYVSFSCSGSRGDNYQSETGSISEGLVYMGLFRDGVLLYFSSSFGGFSMVDSPGPGAHVYSLQVAGAAGGGGPNQAYVSDRTLVALGCKR